MSKSRGILPPRRPWTEVELELLRRDYANTLTADLATALGRPIGQVYSRAQKLGLRKSESFQACDKSGRIFKGGKLGQATQFKPGQAPANKGTRRPGYAPGRMAETQFRPGGKPHTWKPVGTLRINADGYLERKVNDLPGNNCVRWKPVHRLVWEAANGPTPAGHVVVFKPGRFTTVEADITLDAVELVTRRELMARNTVHNLPPELASVVQLRGVLSRRINKLTKEQA